jgi:putative RecB family exonuclease
MAPSLIFPTMSTKTRYTPGFGSTWDYLFTPPRKVSNFSRPTPPARLEIPSVQSPTSVSTFLDCSAKWYYRKVLHLPETRGSALGLGTAVHCALAENFRQKLETREDLPAEGVTAIYRSAMQEQLDTITLQEDEDAREITQKGEDLVRLYMDQAAPRIEPAAVERAVEGMIGDVPVCGVIDVLTADGTVIDIKTASKKPSGMAADHRLQLTTYAMLEPAASGRCRRDALAKTKTISLTPLSMEVTPADRKLTTRLYSIAVDQMKTGIVAPNRSSFLCSRKYCGFADRCVEEFGGEVA